MFMDFRHVLRGLRRSPWFALTVVTTLAVGIGLNAAVFTVVHATLFDGFPLVEHSDRVVYLTTTKDSVYYPDFTEWRTGATSFSAMALARNVYSTLTIGDDDLDAYFTTEVTSNAFALLGVKPILGRDFRHEDEQPGAAPVAMLRYDFWQRRFAADPSIVGRSVRINGVPTVVVGVMPKGFSFPTDQSLWTPLIPSAAALRRETPYARYAFARLAHGATLDGARAQMTAIGERLARAYPSTHRGVTPVLKTFAEWSAGPSATVLYEAAFGAVFFVLLIVCANTANLVLGRALGRSRDVAIRLAIGSSRTRVVRQILLEALLLSTAGGVAGIGLAGLALRVYALAQPPGDYTRILSYAIDGKTFGFLGSVSVGAGIVVGLIAAAGLAHLDASALRGGTRGLSRSSARSDPNARGAADGYGRCAAGGGGCADSQLRQRCDCGHRRAGGQRAHDVVVRASRSISEPGISEVVLS